MSRVITILLIAIIAVAHPYESKSKGVRSDIMIVIDHERFLVHKVSAGETIYSLGVLYEVTHDELFKANPQLRTEGLKAGENIKVPVAAPPAPTPLDSLDRVVVDPLTPLNMDSLDMIDTLLVALEDGEEIEATDKPEVQEILEVLDTLAQQNTTLEERLPSIPDDIETFISHTIEKGETLYSISREYQISIKTLLNDNATLDPSKLSIGEVVKIRRTKQGQSNITQIDSEMKQYGQALESVAPAEYSYYITDNGETINIIAKRAGVSADSIAETNNIDVDAPLSKGTILRIKASKREEELAESMRREDHYMEISPDQLISREEQLFTPKQRGEELVISLLLPITMNGREVAQFAEFYKGFLLGVEDLKDKEYNITVNLFDTQRSLSRVEYIMTEDRFLQSDLIVGPVYEELLETVVNYANIRNIPVVSPLATLTKVSSPVLFQMSPDPTHRYDNIEALLKKDCEVTLIYGESNDSKYEKEIVRMLGKNNIDFTMHSYRYEHPSAISDRTRAAEDLIKQMQRDAEEFDIKLDSSFMHSILPELSTSDLTPLIANKANHNIFFIMSDNRTDVERILSALSSTYNSQRSKNYRRSKQEIRLDRRAPSSYNVVANPDWRDYKSFDHTSYFNNRVVTLSSYQASRESVVIREFDSRYASEYNDFPSLYAYRGYDVAKIFGEGLFFDIMFGMDGIDYTPLQNSYYFYQSSDNQTRKNINWMRVRYNPNFTTNVE